MTAGETETRSPLSGVDILLAEDNPTNQLVATQMLETLGARVSLAVDGVDALRAAETGEFDVFLIDIEMPRLSGLEVIRKLRSPESRHSGKPLIALTAYVMPEHRSAISEAGADGVIAKPIISIDGFGQEIVGMMSRRNPAPDASAAEAETGHAEQAPLNAETLDSLAEMIGGEALGEILDRAEMDLTAGGKALEEAGSRMDIEAIRAASHTLISVAGTIGADRLHDFAVAINRAAHADDSESLRQAIAGYADEQSRVLAALAVRRG